MNRCIPLSGGSNTRRSITPEEREITLKVAEYHPFGLCVLVMLFCGLRPHETSYIQGKDVNGDILHVRGTKSDCADRLVPIPQYLLERLPEIDDEEYLLKSIKGISPMKTAHVNKGWISFKREIEKYIDVANDLVPYCFRHTYCTDLQDAGIPINVAREFMGHSTINLTSKVYTHHTEHTMDNARQLINSHAISHTDEIS